MVKATLFNIVFFGGALLHVWYVSIPVLLAIFWVSRTLLKPRITSRRWSADLPALLLTILSAVGLAILAVAVLFWLGKIDFP
jgi:hypothetical protein